MTAMPGSTMPTIDEKVRTQAQLDRQTIAGPELNIRVSLSPRAILLLAAPVSVLVTMAIGWVLLKSMGVRVYASEMLAASIINIIGGTLAALPLFFWMKRGAIAIAQAGLLGIAIRCGAILGGLVLAFGPGWGLAKMPVAYWTLAFYFPLLIAETAMVGWLSHRAKF